MAQIKVVLFDFGGVLAEEGFREGLYCIARRHGLDPERFYRAARDVVYESGFVTGDGTEERFWRDMRLRFPLQGTDQALSEEILQRFVLRPGMVRLVAQLHTAGLLTGLLSDQTVWLDRLDRRDHFYRLFDRLYISCRLGMGKRAPALFREVLKDLSVPGPQVLFIDDDGGNVARACQAGMVAFRFQDEASCRQRLAEMLGEDVFSAGAA
ncbi:MAG: HAD family hydrolase [Gammaproteobacteria bacterium]